MKPKPRLEHAKKRTKQDQDTVKRKKLRCEDHDTSSVDSGSDWGASENAKEHVFTRKLDRNNEKTIPCIECSKSYKSAVGLRGHINSRHLRPKELTCTWPGCRYVAAYPRFLANHTAAVHEKQYKFSCPANNKLQVCERRFTHRCSALLHYRRVHLGVRVPCPLASCRESFSDADRARDHYRRVHEGDSARWRCPHCRKLLSQASSLLLHIRTVHRKIKQHTCNTCERSFGFKLNLTRHMRTVHQINEDQ